MALPARLELGETQRPNLSERSKSMPVLAPVQAPRNQQSCVHVNVRATALAEETPSVQHGNSHQPTSGSNSLSGAAIPFSMFFVSRFECISRITGLRV
jgi:hypothetical protein